MATDFPKAYQVVGKELGITNPHAIPRVTQVSVNVGVGKQRDDKSFLEAVQRDLALITGQHPHVRRARKAVAGFNVREGNVVAYRLTLRGKRMEDFITRFTQVTLPRVRDFRGIARSSIDKQGNLSVGLREHLAFPEVNPEQTDAVFGVQVTFTTTAVSREAGEILFRQLGFPLTSAAEADAEPTLDIRQGKKVE